MLTVRAACPDLALSCATEVELFPTSQRRSLSWLASLDTCLTSARCPRCRGALTARIGREGPYFHCLCVEKARVAS